MSGQAIAILRALTSRIALLLALVLATGGAAGADTTGCGGSAPYAPPCAPVQDNVSVGKTTTSQPIAPGFVGVSIEYGTVRMYEAPGAGGLDRPFARLIDGLAPGQAPVLRIGGDSTDWTWWPVPGAVRPPGISNALSPAWAALAKALAVSTRAKLILGINLEADNPAIASYEARQLLSGIGRKSVGWLEIGNEPMLYPALPWYHTVSGVPQYGRLGTYNLAAYTNEFDRFRRALPAVPLAGPSIGHSWVTQLGGFIQAAPPQTLVTFHAYGINMNGGAFRGKNCAVPMTDPADPTVPTLLAPSASLGTTRDLGPLITQAHQRGLKFRLDEMNAITCAGMPGVSNTFAAALWSLNALFADAQAGADGVNFHTWRQSAGRLFDFTRAGGRWAGTVEPEYYGLLMFANAAPPGSQLVATTQSNPAALQAWAVTTRTGSVHVVLINDSLTQPVSTNLTAMGAGPYATVEQLTAPSAAATTGVTLNCQSFASPTFSGALSGAPCTTQLARGGGQYTVTVPPASAALVSLSPGT